jgi:hypothetical protein
VSNGKRIGLALSVVLVAVAGAGTGWVVRGPGDDPAPVVATDPKVLKMLARCREAVEQAREGFVLVAEGEATDEAGRRAERGDGSLFEVARRRSETRARQRSVMDRFDVARILCER